MCLGPSTKAQAQSLDRTAKDVTFPVAKFAQCLFMTITLLQCSFQFNTNIEDLKGLLQVTHPPLRPEALNRSTLT